MVVTETQVHMAERKKQSLCGSIGQTARARALAARLKRAWVSDEYQNDVKWEVGDSYDDYGHHADTLDFRATIAPGVRLVYEADFRVKIGLIREEGSVMTGWIQYDENALLAKDLFETHVEQGAAEGPSREKEFAQFADEWMEGFRRGCWLSGCRIELSEEEKAEWVKGLTFEEIESWKLVTLKDEDRQQLTKKRRVKWAGGALTVLLAVAAVVGFLVGGKKER